MKKITFSGDQTKKLWKQALDPIIFVLSSINKRRRSEMKGETMKSLLVISFFAGIAVRLSVKFFRFKIFNSSLPTERKDLLPFSRHLDLNETCWRFLRFCLQRHEWKLILQLHGQSFQRSEKSFDYFWGESEVRTIGDVWQSQTSKPRGHLQENQLQQLYLEVSHDEPRQVFEYQTRVSDGSRPVLRLQLPSPCSIADFDSIFLELKGNAVAADFDRESEDFEKWSSGPNLSREPQRSNMSGFAVIPVVY